MAVALYRFFGTYAPRLVNSALTSGGWAVGARAAAVAREHAGPEDWACGEIVGATLEGDRERAEEIHSADHRAEADSSAAPHHVWSGGKQHRCVPASGRPTYRLRAYYHSIHLSWGTSDARPCSRGYRSQPADSPRSRETLRIPSRKHLLCSEWPELRRLFGARKSGHNRRAFAGFELRAHRVYSKGVFWLPTILAKARANGEDVRLTVAGDGRDRAELERRIGSAGLGGITKFRGWIQEKICRALCGT